MKKKTAYSPSVSNQNKQFKLWHILMSIVAVIVIAYLIFLETKLHFRHQKALNLANTAMVKYSALMKDTAPLSFNQLLPVMDSLHLATSAMKDNPSSLIGNNNEADQHLKIELNKAYSITINTLFLPLLANRYEMAIVKNLKNPDMLYPFLNSYLMLTQPKALDIRYLLATASTIIPDASQANFKQYLLLATSPSFKGLAEQKNIVEAARKNFSTLPLEQQAVIVLLNENINTTDVFKHMQWLTPSNLETPALYTKPEFNDAENTLLPIATNSVLFGNLALGFRQNTSVNPSDLNKLAYTLYLTQYANYWAGILAGLKVAPTHNLPDLTNMLENFSSNESELNAALKTIHDNTDMPEVNYLNKSIHTINELFDSSSQALAALQFKFADTLNDLNNMSRADRISWVNQEIEIRNFTPISLDIPLPSPLDNWLNEVSVQYWQLNLNTVLSDINQEWRSQIYAFYQKYFFEHFPFAANEFPDTDLENFSNFFKPKGILDTFIQNNLKNFINEKQSPWQFRQFPGFTQHSSNSLETLEKLQAITQMFFNNTEHPTLQFSLAPILMTPNIKQVSVNFNRIALTANQGSPNVDIPITWQLSQHDKITLNFLDDNNQTVSFSKTGTWAWLRMLADNKVQAVDPQNYTIRFNSGILQAQYELKTNNAANPFDPSALSGMSLPKDFFN